VFADDGRLTVENPTIEFNSTRLFLIDLSLDPAIALPQHLMHHIDMLGAPSPGPKPTAQVLLGYTVAPLDISRKLPVISAPLSGNGWVAVNGCCGADSIHRSSDLSVNGGIYFAQRFAIDWMRLDEARRFVHGNALDVHSFDSYGQDVLAVADGSRCGRALDRLSRKQYKKMTTRRDSWWLHESPLPQMKWNSSPRD